MILYVGMSAPIINVNGLPAFGQAKLHMRTGLSVPRGGPKRGLLPGKGNCSCFLPLAWVHASCRSILVLRLLYL